MTDLFSDLGSLGLDPINNLDIFKKKEEKVVKEKPKAVVTASLLYEASIRCPSCDRDITYRAVRSGLLKLEKTDLDLRPIYRGFDPSMYDVIICSTCGYGTLKKNFQNITQKKKLLLREKVSYQFVGKTYPDEYTYDIAIERYKLALYDAIVMESLDSEKAYLCLKIAWLYRGAADQLILDHENEMGNEGLEAKLNQYKASEQSFLKHTVEGFKNAYQLEHFPAMGLDDLTVRFLIAELSRRIGNHEEAIKWAYEVISSKSASRRLKDRAIETKELSQKEKANNKAE